MAQIVPELIDTLATQVLAMPTLATPTLAMPTLAMPVLATPTLATPVLATPGRVPTQPTTLIHSLCLTLKTMRKGRCLSLPIKKLNNISVEVSIAKENKNMYILNIMPLYFNVADDSLYESIYDRMRDDRTNAFNEDEFIQFILKDILSALKKIKIDKLNGLFTTDPPSPQDQKLHDMWASFCQEFKEEEHMELTMNECCVCFTMTKTTTNCGHSVCLECISKLRTDSHTDDHLMHINCPMCRQQITHLI